MIRKGFYFITDSFLTRQGVVADVQQALQAGVVAVQYRHKAGSQKVMVQQAKAIRALCQQVPLIINDDLALAQSVGADGVHLGQSDISCLRARAILGPGQIIGVSVQTLAQANEAQALGADYLGVGPIFPTFTKKDAAPPCGVELIEDIKKQCLLPVVAIGGITLENADRVIKAGADAICAISATVDQPHVGQAVDRFNQLWRRHHC